jgi:peroxiredoxin
MNVIHKIRTLFQRAATGVGFAALLLLAGAIFLSLVMVVGMFFGGAADWIAKDFGPFLKRYGIGADALRWVVLGLIIFAAWVIGANVERDKIRKKHAEEERAAIEATLARGGSVSPDALQAAYARPSYRKYWIIGLSLIALCLVYNGVHESIDYKRFNKADRSATAHVVESDPGEAGQRETDLMQLPHDLPVPADDGACDHLPGSTLPSVSLVATTGGSVDLSKVPGCVVVFAYPRTGRPNEPPLVQNWDLIPGARGCTPQTCGFRDLHSKFEALHCRVYGLSTQSPEYQQEMVARLHVPFPVLSDEKLEFIRALRLPTFTVAEQVLVKRLVLVLEDGRVKKVFYPVFPPDKSASTVLEWLSAAGQWHSR